MRVPSFGTAFDSFQRFVRGQHEGSLRWVFREELRLCGARFEVRTPIPAANEALVRELFEEGRTRGLGIELRVLCRVGADLCCYVRLPADEEDPGGLKLSVASPLLEAEAIEEWGPLPDQSENSDWLAEVPFRER